MKNKKLWNRCKTVLGMTLLACTVLGTPVTTLTVEAAVVEDTVSPCSDICEWQYKIENNKLYKRLFNCTACIWLTDWIFVRDLSEDV